MDSGSNHFTVMMKRVFSHEYSAMISKFSKNREALLCAHNGKEFDYPYIARRMIINGIPDSGYS